MLLWRLVWLPDGEKISKIFLFVLTECTNVSDRRTDGHCMTAKAALDATIARKKNCKRQMIGLYTKIHHTTDRRRIQPSAHAEKALLKNRPCHNLTIGLTPNTRPTEFDVIFGIKPFLKFLIKFLLLKNK